MTILKTHFFETIFVAFDMPTTSVMCNWAERHPEQSDELSNWDSLSALKCTSRPLTVPSDYDKVQVTWKCLQAQIDLSLTLIGHSVWDRSRGQKVKMPREKTFLSECMDTFQLS